MVLDLKNRIQNVNGYGDRPFSFVGDAQQILGDIVSIDLIENGDRPARENWQKKQLSHLINHAYLRSSFWRQRIPSGVRRQDVLGRMPILMRKDVARQVQNEGPLFVDKNRGAESSYETTGSTGTPLMVFVCPQNGTYNNLRNLAQIFLDNLSFDENRVQIGPALRSDDLRTRSAPHWAGPLSRIYRNGSNKKIDFNRDVDGLVEELSKDSVGYLVCPSRVLELLLHRVGPDLIKKLGIKVWIHLGDYRSREAVEQLKQIGIQSLSNYSSAETGPIAFECRINQGYYHIAHTNVMVECDDALTTTFDGVTVGRLLITHLHSYATPLIRYDVGDFGKLHHRCPCGHDGPAISHIYGKGKHFLRHPDGRSVPFYLGPRSLRQAVEFKECRFRQETVDTIEVQIGGRETLTPGEEEKLKALIIGATDPAFRVIIKPVKEIDWSDNPKQLFFSSSVV
jgi:phenylacetate-CoA ligase